MNIAIRVAGVSGWVMPLTKGLFEDMSTVVLLLSH
jgi:hypothetical protein